MSNPQIFSIKNEVLHLLRSISEKTSSLYVLFLSTRETSWTRLVRVTDVCTPVLRSFTTTVLLSNSWLPAIIATRNPFFEAYPSCAPIFLSSSCLASSFFLSKFSFFWLSLISFSTSAMRWGLLSFSRLMENLSLSISCSIS